MNNAHRYVVELTACDKGVPSRCSTANVVVPLTNYNSHPPTYQAPVLIYASITLTKGSQLGQLNAFDVDGDNIKYSIHSSSESFNHHHYETKSKKLTNCLLYLRFSNSEKHN